MLKIKEEIDQLKGHVIQIANTTYAGRHIFSGHSTDEPLLDENGKYNIDLNMEEVFEYNVGVSERVNVNTVGIRVFGVLGSGDDVIVPEDPDGFKETFNEQDLMAGQGGTNLL